MLNKSNEFLPCGDGPLWQPTSPGIDLDFIKKLNNSIPVIVPMQDYSHRMNPLDFCYWLQGLMEVGNPKTLDETQVQHIKNHLNMVFENTAGFVEQVIYASC